MAAPAGSDPAMMTSIASQLEGIGFEAGFTSEQVIGHFMASAV